MVWYDFQLKWSDLAAEDLEVLPVRTQERVIEKVEWFVAQENPLHFAKQLSGLPEKMYRFRVGDYRILFEIVHGKILILLVHEVKHRRKAYD